VTSVSRPHLVLRVQVPEDYQPVRCNTGSTPPADGTIVGPSEKSTFTFDESMLTGESKPVVKKLGDKVFLGSINRGQSVHIRVDTIGGGTMYVVSLIYLNYH
jgi:cation transport ATPase